MPQMKAAPRVRETSQTTGVVTYVLLGAPVGFQPFSVLGATNLCKYFATDGVNWEEGIGTVLTGPNRLERTKILRSSNADAAVNWGAGTRTLRCGEAAEMALPRYLAKSVAGGANVVLTQDEQRRDIIEFTGALTANIQVEVDTTPWRWVIRNATTGAFSLEFRITAVAGITIPQGRRQVIYNDGGQVSRAGPAVEPNGSEFAAGTKIVFQQTSAPLGWTKDTTHNDKALRVVSGTVGSGGATAFSSVFGAGKVTGAKTLATSEIPSHNHNVFKSNGAGAQGPDVNVIDGAGTALTSSTGGGGAHDHTLSLDLQYADVIVATKD